MSHRHAHHAPPGLGEPEFFAHAHAVAAPAGAPGTVPLHLNGVLLPDGEVRDLWVVDGVIRVEPVAGAVTVCRGAWIMPGLVDAHCHIGLGTEGAVSGSVLGTYLHGPILPANPVFADALLSYAVPLATGAPFEPGDLDDTFADEARTRQVRRLVS